MGVEGPELRVVPKRLLEVVTDDFVELDGPLAEVFEPGRMALVQPRTCLLGDGVIGRVTDEQMAEAERALTREVRLVVANQVPPNQPEESMVSICRLGAGELGH